MHMVGTRPTRNSGEADVTGMIGPEGVTEASSTVGVEGTPGNRGPRIAGGIQATALSAKNRSSIRGTNHIRSMTALVGNHRLPANQGPFRVNMPLTMK
jgi:hypothetical protein